MSQRKLQQEIDRIFKKVKEGLEEFDYTYNKFQECENQSQKEKIESDLKKEIKKLQRHREQIKNWISGNEVKDKSALLEHRRLVEVEMERFKDVEKAMKTKAFSNEALAATTDNLDPRKREKNESADFIQGNIEELERQIESLEAKVDSLTSGKKKKLDSSKQAQISSCNEAISRHKWHISMLESVLRHLENDNIEVDQINDIKEDIEYYVESNQDPNFIEDETFYDVLGLDDIEDSFAVIPNDDYSESTPPPQSQPQPQQQQESQPQSVSISPISSSVSTAKKVIKKRDELQRSQTEPTTLAAQLQQTHLNSTPLGSPKLAKPTISTTISGGSSSPASSLPLSSAIPSLKPATPVETPKLKYSAVASQAIQATLVNTKSNAGSNVNTPLQSFAALVAKDKEDETRSTTPSTPNFKVMTGSLSTSNGTSQIQQTYFSGDLRSVLTFSDESNFNNLPTNYENYVKSLDQSKDRLFQFKEQESFHVPSKKYQPPPPICELKLPALDDIISHLETSLLTCPDSHDSDTPMMYEPMNPYVTQLSYPLDPLMDLNSSKIMERLELDTLQYCFYYHSLQMPSQYTPFHNTHQNNQDRREYVQWLAARELRNRGWNYYGDHHQWITNEGGEFKAFDSRDTWLTRRQQSNFQPNPSTLELNY